MRSLGRLLAVIAGFAFYFLAIIIVIAWFVSLILISVNHGSRAALLFTAKTLLPLILILGVMVLFYGVIKRSPSKRTNSPKKKTVR